MTLWAASIFMACFCFTPLHAMAEPAPPVPARKLEALNELQTRLESKKAEQQALREQLKHVEKNLSATKEKLVEVAGDVRRNEKHLQDLETRISTLEREQADIESRLEKDHHSIAQVILAMERIRRTPPEVLMVRPGAPLQTAQSALLLKTILPEVGHHAHKLAEDLTRLDTIKEDLRKDRDDAVETARSLHEKQIKIRALLRERKNIYHKTKRDYKNSEKDMAQMAAQASSLQDLVKKLNKQKEKQKQKQEQDNMRMAGGASLTGPLPVLPPASMPKRGNVQLPLAGTVQIRYGETNMIGARSEGLIIKGRSGALVVAPMGGVVRFASTFKNFGKLIIIEHAHGYHSIIAGLDKIDTVMGQSVEAGEPIGRMPVLNSEAPKLYYELRLKGKPVNPSRKFAGLS